MARVNRSVAARNGFLAVAFPLLLVAVARVPAFGAPPDLPDSQPGQALVNRAEEIFRVHPEKAKAEAVPLLQRVLDDYPGTRQASLALAYLSYGHHAIGDPESAAKYQQQLETAFPASRALGELYLLRGEAWYMSGEKERGRQNYAAAVEILSQHVSHQDGRLMRWFAADKLAALYDQESNPQQAVSILKEAAQALRGTPQEVAAWREILRITEAHQGEIPALTPTLTQVRDDDLSGLTTDARAAAMLALASNDAESARYEAALTLLLRIAERYSGSAHMPGVLISRADLVTRLDPEHPDASITLWREAIERYPRDERVSEAHFALARQAIAEGATAQATAHLQAIRDNIAFVPAARGLACVKLGDAYRALGDDAQARRCYQDARTLGAGTDPAWQAVRKLEEMGDVR
jgi:tetratricopeptide (TPR) repeat protein